MMSEEHIIRHCAPTLAGLKTGSMFTCPYSDKKALLDTLRQLNRRLGPKGLRIIPLRFSHRKALIYLYRPNRLRNDLSDSTAIRLLEANGYRPESREGCVVQLAQRIRNQEDFPHEIGLFLGYPPEDVCGFIENGACGFKCVGCWKVYGDEAAAKKKFAQYKKCTKVYCDQWANGKAIERLTVAERNIKN